MTMKSVGLKQVEVGQTFQGYCIVRKLELKQKQDGEPYLVVEVGDRTGRLTGVVWNHAEELYRNLRNGQILKIRGKLRLFQERKQLQIEKIRLAREGEIQQEDLLPRSEKAIAPLYQRFLTHYQSIENEPLKQLLQAIFPEEKMLQQFLKLPSGKLWHHNYLYGMLEHLVALLDLTEPLLRHYPALNADLLKTGIILYALGTEQTFRRDGFIEYSDRGRLLGRALLGALQVEQKIREIENFPEELRDQILHMLISQSGRDATDAPAKPMTREAIALQKLIELDITLNAVERIIRHDRLPHTSWTRYNNLLDRFIYVGDETNHQDNGK
jgi:3'-5' exoribonuclease